MRDLKEIDAEAPPWGRIFGEITDEGRAESLETIEWLAGRNKRLKEGRQRARQALLGALA